MAGGFWGGLGKLVHLGALHVQHVAAAKQAAQLGGDAGHQHLFDYFATLTDPQFDGFKFSVGMAAQQEADPGLRQALAWIAQNADALRNQPPSPTAALAAGGEAAYQQHVRLLEHWYELAGQNRSDEIADGIEALVREASEPAFQTFLGHLERMHGALDQAIEQARHDEAGAWGRFSEDRIAYMLAKLQTGATDPKTEATIARYQDQQTFLHKVHEYARQCRAQPAPPPDPVTPPAVEPPAAEDPELDLDAIFSQFETLRQQALDSGELRGERAHATKAWLAEVEDMARAHQNGESSPSDTLAAIGRIYRKRQDMIHDSGADLAEHQPEGSRARTLGQFIQLIKTQVTRQAMGVAVGQTRKAYIQLFTDIGHCIQPLQSLPDDAAALGFERTELRPLAMQTHELAVLPHLVLARPFWECPPVDASANAVFFSGADDLLAVLRTVLDMQRLDLARNRSGRYYGQARWDLIRASHVCVFDWRAHARDLGTRDPGAAALQAGIGYELGLALSLGKPVVIVARPGQAMPFDIDIEPIRLDDAPEDNEHMLAEAIDHALYEVQRTADDGCLGETRQMFLALAEQLDKTHVFEGMGWLNADLVNDSVGFQSAALQMIRGVDEVALLTPAWASPELADPPALFHVTPFSLPWSNAGRSAIQHACAQAGVVHTDGETANDSRILQRIWDGIYRAQWIVADVTDLNPNVFIELAMAHALGRKSLIVEQARDGQPPPGIRNLEKIEFMRYDDFDDLTRIVTDWIGEA